MAPERRRLFLLQVKHAKFGTVPSSVSSAMLLYAPHDNESYIVGGRIEDWLAHKARSNSSKPGDSMTCGRDESKVGQK
jgi:hypothetical protein